MLGGLRSLSWQEVCPPPLLAACHGSLLLLLLRASIPGGKLVSLTIFPHCFLLFLMLHLEAAALPQRAVIGGIGFKTDLTTKALECSRLLIPTDVQVLDWFMPFAEGEAGTIHCKNKNCC